jgi:hypothetical protein
MLWDEKCNAVNMHNCCRIQELSKKRNTKRAIYKRMTLHKGDSSLRSEGNLKSVAIQSVCSFVAHLSFVCLYSIMIPLLYFKVILYFRLADFLIA